MTNSQRVSRASHIMKRSFQPTMAALLLAVTMTLTPGIASAAVIEVSDLNIIQQAGNPSDGLRFLDLSFSVGLNQADALVNAQATYANARLATPSEWDDLFAAAGIAYDGGLTAADAFTVGANADISTGSNYDGGILMNQLGPTTDYELAAAAVIWSAPNGDWQGSSTRDDLVLIHIKANPTYGISDEYYAYIEQHPNSGEHSSFGWMIVSDAAAVPEPSTAALLGLGMAGCALARRRLLTNSWGCRSRNSPRVGDPAACRIRTGTCRCHC